MARIILSFFPCPSKDRSGISNRWVKTGCMSHHEASTRSATGGTSSPWPWPCRPALLPPSSRTSPPYARRGGRVAAEKGRKWEVLRLKLPRKKVQQRSWREFGAGCLVLELGPLLSCCKAESRILFVQDPTQLWIFCWLSFKPAERGRAIVWDMQPPLVSLSTPEGDSRG